MRVLPKHIIRDLKRHDVSLDVLWNNRIMRWVVVQHLPNKWFPVGQALRGCSATPGEKTNYKVMFVCEHGTPGTAPGDGLPVVPAAPWIIARLEEFCPTKEKEAEQVKEQGGLTKDELREKKIRDDADKQFDDRMDDMGKDLLTYGGVGDYSHDDVLGKKHFTPPKKILDATGSEVT